MAANQFLPFATGSGAFVLTPAEYQALALRSSGWAPGLLTKENLNTALRQPGFVAAALSQIVADNQPSDVLDNGVVADWIARYKVGVRNLGATDVYLADTGTANAYVVAYSPVQAALVDGQLVVFKAANSNTGASTLDAGPGAVTLRRQDGGALQADDVPAGTIVTARYDATAVQWRLQSIVVSQLGVLGAANYITSTVTLTKGVYGMNSTSGAFTATLPLGPTTGDQITLVDLANQCAINPVTLARNGQTIEGIADDLDITISNCQFTIWFNGTTWKLV